MRRRVRHGGDDADVDMTPMLDIVFIMLIFFIVTATFFDEKGKDFTQPPPPPPQMDNPKDAKPAIAVYVDAKNRCSVDGKQSDCDRVVLTVESLLAEKPGANIILKVSEVADTFYLVTLKDNFDVKGLDTKIEMIPEG